MQGNAEKLLWDQVWRRPHGYPHGLGCGRELVSHLRSGVAATHDQHLAPCKDRRIAILAGMFQCAFEF